MERNMSAIVFDASAHYSRYRKMWEGGRIATQLAEILRD